ncbi:MAG: glycosyltransferase family 39 protein [Chloroflexi bacterium]|nr:glycosyltransferase family 39 protein [Chloroflexota bacterium]MCL5274938.1 glycosyltransferase family 39 protein [Chloroflexota bacterium]
MATTSDKKPDASGRRSLYALLAILAVSVLLRFGAVAVMGDQVEALPGIADQQSYDMLAKRVLGGYGFTVAQDWWPMTRAGEPTAHWSYLYTLYLSAVYLGFGVHPLAARIIQVLLVGVLWPLLAYRITRRLLGNGAGLIAAAWTAVYGYAVYYSAALMTEPFYITAILWSFDIAMNRSRPKHSAKHWGALGLALGIIVLLRQSFLPFVPFLLAWMWLSERGSKPFAAGWLRTLTYPLLSLCVMGILILPWTIRNYSAFGRFVLLNTNAGFAFYWANHPIYGTTFVDVLPPDISYQSLVPPELQSLDEAALDSALLKRGIEFVVQDPVRYVLLSISRVRTYFMFWPSPGSGTLNNLVRVLSFGVALPFILYGLILALKRWRDWSLLYLFVIIYSGVHLLSWALVRYRLPVDAVLILFASCGLADLLRRFQPHRAVTSVGVSQ